MRMTELETPPPVSVQGKNAAMIAYVLLLLSTVIPFTGLIGAVVAYVYRDEAPEWLQTHFRLQIRTFWISVLAVVLSMLLMFIKIGFLLLLAWLVWFLVRCIKGIRLLNLNRPYPNPQTWGL